MLRAERGSERTRTDTDVIERPGCVPVYRYGHVRPTFSLSHTHNIYQQLKKYSNTFKTMIFCGVINKYREWHISHMDEFFVMGRSTQRRWSADIESWPQ